MVFPEVCYQAELCYSFLSLFFKTEFPTMNGFHGSYILLLFSEMFRAIN
jgi:hypothetical protein